MNRFAMLVLLALPGAGACFAQQDEPADVADVPNQELAADKDQKKDYFLIGPMKEDKEPKDGFGLVVIMPGGSGAKEMNAFVRRIYKNALGAGWIAAQPVAVKWTEDQETIWPTDKSRVPGMKFTTEEFVEAVIKDVGTRKKVDPSRIFTVSWSSSGPAAYALSLRPKTPIKGSFIAMSVFRTEWLPDLDAAKGHPYYLYHSKDDTTCAFSHAEKARELLTAKGATVEIKEYAGGHGWSGNVYGAFRDGFKWLLETTAKKK